MAGHKKVDVLMKKMTPAQRERIEAAAQKQLQEMLLAELRKTAGQTQVEVAEAMGIKQPSLSRLESEDDMQISTLRRIIEALGGKLEIIAELPGTRVSLSQFTGAKSEGKQRLPTSRPV